MGTDAKEVREMQGSRYNTIVGKKVYADDPSILKALIVSTNPRYAPRLSKFTRGYYYHTEIVESYQRIPVPAPEILRQVASEIFDSGFTNILEGTHSRLVYREMCSSLTQPTFGYFSQFVSYETIFKYLSVKNEWFEPRMYSARDRKDPVFSIIHDLVKCSLDRVHNYAMTDPSNKCWALQKISPGLYKFKIPIGYTRMAGRIKVNGGWRTYAHFIFPYLLHGDEWVPPRIVRVTSVQPASSMRDQVSYKVLTEGEIEPYV